MSLWLDEHLDTLVVDGTEVDIYGFYDPQSTPEGQWEGYDVYWQGECLNEGDLFPYRPAPQDISPLLARHILKEGS